MITMEHDFMLSPIPQPINVLVNVVLRGKLNFSFCMDRHQDKITTITEKVSLRVCMQAEEQPNRRLAR